MNIIIIGDSWAVPNYITPQPGWRARNHLSELLVDDGHSVLNMGQNGGSNIYSFQRLERQYEGFKEFNNWEHNDYCIWYHTSMIRDAYEVIGKWRASKCSNERLHAAADMSYAQIKQILQNLDIKNLIVMEGYSPIVEPEFSKHLSPLHVVKNLRAHITGQQLPNPFGVGESVYAENLKVSNAELELHINQVEQVQNAMAHSRMFPDYCHPDDRANKIIYDIVQGLIT